MVEKLLGLLILAGVSYLIFVVRTSSKKYIETKFDEQLERFRNELQKATIQTTASYNYKQFVTQEAFSVTVDLYRKIFDARKFFHMLWDREIEADIAKKYLNELRNYQLQVFANQILLDEEVFAHFKHIFGGFLVESTNIRTGLNPESKDIKEINTSIVTVTNLVRDKFGLKGIPAEIVSVEIPEIEKPKES